MTDDDLLQVAEMLRTHQALSSQDIDLIVERLFRRIENSMVIMRLVKRSAQEAALHAVAVYEMRRSVGVVKSFLHACGARGVDVKLSADGKTFHFTHAIGEDLRAIAYMYRTEILNYLIHLREMERRELQRKSEAHNGVAKRSRSGPVLPSGTPTAGATG